MQINASRIPALSGFEWKNYVENIPFIEYKNPKQKRG
jgi:hypothetical protein